MDAVNRRGTVVNNITTDKHLSRDAEIESITFLDVGKGKDTGRIDLVVQLKNATGFTVDTCFDQHYSNLISSSVLSLKALEEGWPNGIPETWHGMCQ